jgi:hypothetical protein
LKRCHQLLKNQGYLVVTEAVYLLPDIPEPLRKFWDEGYSDIKDIQGNISLIQKEGFNLLSHFTLPKSSWIDNYYTHMENRMKEMKKKYHNNTIALQVFEECEKEIQMYNAYSDYYGYEFFIMRK